MKNASCQYDKGRINFVIGKPKVLFLLRNGNCVIGKPEVLFLPIAIGIRNSYFIIGTDVQALMLRCNECFQRMPSANVFDDLYKNLDIS